ncbi:hypothetical protein TTHERM_000310399 (macronuclear) [Tetrahymena thermophila SB210]|uniref:Uncharacterized protein n=1 Tax=Tetrahymena thermophila (strain SB210) TaxID=312017 RepID=W7XGC1_TETTS|nr:hypothetical protein TTHERM_000310399 [Tetrahymena thermophila SB210]EWS73156.1 hypothetical protein TTHERM_000310399 [Tetrahymena thermophila SB210]|eukprot:XP_012654343.1 hypothetical protein TTHERM_000310399 [Tetrahymena thermophila SB210]
MVTLMISLEISQKIDPNLLYFYLIQVNLVIIKLNNKIQGQQAFSHLILKIRTNQIKVNMILLEIILVITTAKKLILQILPFKLESTFYMLSSMKESRLILIYFKKECNQDNSIKIVQYILKSLRSICWSQNKVVNLKPSIKVLVKTVKFIKKFATYCKLTVLILEQIEMGFMCNLSKIQYQAKMVIWELFIKASNSKVIVMTIHLKILLGGNQSLFKQYKIQWNNQRAIFNLFIMNLKQLRVSTLLKKIQVSFQNLMLIYKKQIWLQIRI